MSETKPLREWTCTASDLADINLDQGKTYERLLTVREVSAEHDAAVEGMREALEDIRSRVEGHAYTLADRALKAFDAAVKGLK